MTARTRIFPGYRDNRIHLIAHRGFTPAAPQNSAKAFKEAGKRGYWAIETDVRRTADGHLVCIHDAEVSHLFQGNGMVEEMTLAQLQQLRWKGTEEIRMPGMGAAAGIPLFMEYLKICYEAKAVPFIETKTMDVEQVLKETAMYFGEKDFVISSCTFEHLEEVRRYTSQVFIHHIFSDQGHLERLAQMGHAGVSYNYPNLDDVPEGLIGKTHEMGVCVCLRAGDSIESVRRMHQMGLDYIPTNKMEPKGIQEVHL